MNQNNGIWSVGDVGVVFLGGLLMVMQLIRTIATGGCGRTECSNGKATPRPFLMLCPTWKSLMGLLLMPLVVVAVMVAVMVLQLARSAFQ